MAQNPHYLLIPRPSHPIDAAIRYYGTKTALARAIGFTPQAISMWRARHCVPRYAARAIEIATNGQCSEESFATLRDCDWRADVAPEQEGRL